MKKLSKPYQKMCIRPTKDTPPQVMRRGLTIVVLAASPLLMFDVFYYMGGPMLQYPPIEPVGIPQTGAQPGLSGPGRLLCHHPRASGRYRIRNYLYPSCQL